MEHQGYEGERGRYADADLGADRTSERFGKWKSTWQDTDLYAKRILPCDRSGLDKTVRVQMFVTSVCDDRSPVSVLRLEERSDPKQAWCSCGVISLAIACRGLDQRTTRLRNRDAGQPAVSRQKIPTVGCPHSQRDCKNPLSAASSGLATGFAKQSSDWHGCDGAKVKQCQKGKAAG